MILFQFLFPFSPIFRLLSPFPISFLFSSIRYHFLFSPSFLFSFCNSLLLFFHLISLFLFLSVILSHFLFFLFSSVFSCFFFLISFFQFRSVNHLQFLFFFFLSLFPPLLFPCFVFCPFIPFFTSLRSLFPVSLSNHLLPFTHLPFLSSSLPSVCPSERLSRWWCFRAGGQVVNPLGAQTGE